MILAALTMLTAGTLHIRGETVPKFTGHFDRHVVEMTWYGLCSDHSSTTNTLDGPIEVVPLPDNALICMARFLAVNADLKLNFPLTTPAGTTNSLQTLRFDVPLLSQVELAGTLTFSDLPDMTNDSPNTQQLTVEVGPYDIRATESCPKETVIDGPPLVHYVPYSLDVRSACRRSSMIFPEREGDDLVYEMVSFVSLLIYEPAMPPGSRVLFGGDILIKSYYRVNLNSDQPPDSPELNLTLTSGQFVLSWPASATGYVLESTDQLAPPHPWEMQTNVERAGDRNVYRVTPVGQGRFYRLRRP